MTISAIYGSPRKDGNSDLLLQAFVRGAKEQGAQVQELFLRNLKISPCIECGGCNTTGQCVLQDDMDQVYPQLIHSTVIALAAPIFFYAMNAMAKAMVDRSQCFWARKYLLKKPLSEERGEKGRGILISVGATKGKKNFDCIDLTARYFFDGLDMEYGDHLFFGGVDEKGAILEHPTACDEAFELGKKTAASEPS